MIKVDRPAPVRGIFEVSRMRKDVRKEEKSPVVVDIGEEGAVPDSQPV